VSLYRTRQPAALPRGETPNVANDANVSQLHVADHDSAQAGKGEHSAGNHLEAWWAQAIDPFDIFLFVLFALMMSGALLLIVPYLRSVEEEGRRANPRC
jgi:hypothetical protein